MTDERDKTSESAGADSESKRPAAGERLAEARRERQIGVHEVAKRLHLDDVKVRALERNDFDVLGAPVFAKGHLRKYAELVGIDKDDIIADYYRMTHMADLPPVVHDRPRLRQHMSPVPWTIAIIAIAAAGAAYWWFTTDRAGTGLLDMLGQERPEVSVPADDAPVDEPAGEVPMSVAEVASARGTDVSAAGPDSEVAPAAAPQRQELRADGQTQLRIRYSGDCWTEITDANGERLFFDMGRTGRTVEVAGTAPFTILFGNSENVSLQVNGADYPVSPNTEGSRTARLTVMKP